MRGRYCVLLSGDVGRAQLWIGELGSDGREWVRLALFCW